MAIGPKEVKDRLKLEFNPVTRRWDYVLEYNSDKILTHECNMIGNPLMIYDVVTNTYMQMGPLVVTDNDGNVVSAG